MDDIFGIPMFGIAVALAAFLALCLLTVIWIALRRPIIFKLGVRNIARRKAQTALIVIGLMLSTLIIAAALGTGDTVSHSITSDTYTNLGQLDELVVVSQSPEASGDLTYQETLPAGALATVEAALAGDPDVDGVMAMLDARLPVINEADQLAEPDTVVTGLDPAGLEAFGGMRDVNGDVIDFRALEPGQVVVSEKLADAIDAGVGDALALHVNGDAHGVIVAAVARDSYLSGTRRSRNVDLEYPGLAMPLATLQALLVRPGEISAVAVSNTGDSHDGVDHTEAVVAKLGPQLAGLGLGIDTIKQDRVDNADRISSAFTQVFILLGLFSVMSGVLLIVLIFTMLASERRSEMGIARAVGTQRGQLVQQFIAEGSGYALFAGLVGTLLGVLAAYGIAEGMKLIFGQYAPIEAHVTPRSLVVAYCLGMAITFLTVVASSWKISRINIVAAVRDIPDIVTSKRKRATLVWAGLLTVIGTLLALAGSGGGSAEAFSTGMTLIPFGVVLFLRWFGVPGRLPFTLTGLYIVAFWMLPESTFKSLFGDYEFGLSMFFLAGIFTVIGATLVILQNTDLLLRGVSALGGLFRSQLPAVRTAVAYPGAARGRTGMTIAMFSLIIFSLVMISTMNSNYIESALGDEANAGWDVRADANGPTPPADFIASLQAQGVDTSGFEAVGLVTNPNEHHSQVRLAGAEEWKRWPVLGADPAFLDHSQIVFGQRANGYETDAEVMAALVSDPNVAVIDSWALPTEGDIGGNDELFALEGLESGDDVFEPIEIELQSPVDGSAHRLTIIGVIDSKIGSLSGLYTSQTTVDAVYPNRASSSWYVALRDPAASDEVAKQVESALLRDGVEGVSIRDELRDAQKQESGFLYIIEGFMGLGLVVGVAAVGVIAFRSVVKRRQQIGVLRAIGFQREMVSLSFMIETLFVVGLGVLSGVALGLGLAKRLVADPDQGFSSDVSFVIPWTTILPIIGLTVLVALLMTWIPAQQAGRVAPAEALRYE